MSGYNELQESVIAGDEDKVKEIVSQLISKGSSPTDIISEGLLSGMAVVGQRFKASEMFIPEVLASAKAMSRGMELVKPLIVGTKLANIKTGKVVIGTVHGDFHNIGKNLVSMMLESAGFTVIDIGIDVQTDKFVEATKREQPDILGISALLTTTMPRMKDIVEALKHSNLKDKVKVLVGGAPVTQSFADLIGADGYAPNAIAAIDKAKELLR